MTSAPEQTNTRYEFLIRRAVEFLGNQGGRATEDQIVQHVFGSGAPTALWSSLLRQVLSSEPAVSLLADGRWALAGYSAPPAMSALGDFTALDVETTGLRPLTHRIIEVAAVRYRNGREAESYVSFVQPDKSLSAVIVNLTGIRDIDLEDAPRFQEIADDLLSFIGDDLIVGHNVGFDLSFVNGELKRLSRPGVPNAHFDTLAAANRLLPELKRKSLGKLAASLGIPEGRNHRAYDDAVRTAEVALRLVETAAIKGIKDQVSIRRIGGAMPRQNPDGSRPRRNVLDRSLLSGIPRAPGVYLMFDGYGHVMYIGKARNLRERVGSYFSQQLGYTRKMDGLLESLVSIETHRTGSELEALLLEAQLIRFYQPRYNTALRASENYPYIKINISNPWPRIALTKAVKDDGALYFGPYKSRGAAERAITIMNAALPLRTCTRSFRNAKSYGKPCLKLDLKQCLGPCTGHVDRAAYRELVQIALSLLEGDGTGIVERLEQEIDIAVTKLDAQKAQRLRNDIQTVQLVAQAQQSISYAVEHHDLLLIQESAQTGGREVMLVLRGLRWAQFQVGPGESAQDLAIRLVRSFDRYSLRPSSGIDHASLDDALILNRWIRRQSGHPCMIAFSPDDPDLDWLALAEHALALGEDELSLDLAKEPDDEIEPEAVRAFDREPPPGENYPDPDA
jgi:DNA polymerase III epsilon subunit family exonuclease